MKDEDVVELCKNYPIKPSENMDATLAANQGLQTQMELVRNDIKRKQNKLVRLCEEESRQTRVDKFNLDLQQLLGTFKSDEFVRN